MLRDSSQRSSRVGRAKLLLIRPRGYGARGRLLASAFRAEKPRHLTALIAKGTLPPDARYGRRGHRTSGVGKGSFPRPFSQVTLTQTNGEARRFTISFFPTNITTPTTQHRPAYGVDGMVARRVSDRSGLPGVGKRSRVLFQFPARVLYDSRVMAKCYELPSVMDMACFRRGYSKLSPVRGNYRLPIPVLCSRC